MVVGTGIAARLGIHFKSAESLERLSGVDTIIFDKTGTLTTGRSSLNDVEPGPGNEEFVSIGQSMEIHSEHHIANAIVSFLESRNLPVYDVEAFEAVSGLGIRGIINGEIVRVGSIQYLRREDVKIPARWEKCDDKLRSQGKTVVHVASGKEWLGLVAVSDEIRIETEQVIYDLQTHGIETWMITGDNMRTAQIVAQTIGIKNIMAEILPEDKSNKVRELKQKGKVVAMVGDGINDAPALATADVGISISTGTDVAIETSDVVLMRPELTGVKIALALSRAVVSKIRQNLFWAFFYNIIGIPVALGLLYPFTGYLLSPVIAGAAMAFSSVSVVSNTLLLKKKRF
jgi:Cu+-exporting ATPase